MINPRGFQFGDVFWIQDRMTGPGTGIHPWVVIRVFGPDIVELCLRTTSLPPGSPGSVEIPAVYQGRPVDGFDMDGRVNLWQSVKLPAWVVGVSRFGGRLPKDLCDDVQRALSQGGSRGPRREWGAGSIREVSSMEYDEPSPVAAGQLWQAADVAGVLLVVHAIAEDPIIATHPVSLETRYLSSEDVRIKAHETLLAAPAMVEAWHCLPVDRAALSHFLGEVPEEVLELVLRLRFGVATQADRAARSGTKLPSDPRDPIVAFWHRELEYWKPAGARAIAWMLSLDPGEEEAATAEIPLELPRP